MIALEQSIFKMVVWRRREMRGRSTLRQAQDERWKEGRAVASRLYGEGEGLGDYGLGFGRGLRVGPGFRGGGDKGSGDLGVD